MRLFLAIELPDEVKKQIAESLIDLQEEYPQFRWVTANNYHITIYFFGEVCDLKKIEKMKKNITDLLYDQESFHLYSTNADLFIHDKIVVYLNFRREKKLENLAEKISERFGSRPGNHKKFVPHLTLARCRIPSKQQYFVLKKRLGKIKIDVEFPVDKVYLYESTNVGDKPVYNKIAEFPLLK
jgi:2'-5' RNA ligase